MYLKANNTGTRDQFGASVAVSGDTVVVGADLEDSSTTGVNSTPNEFAEASGSAYVFGVLPIFGDGFESGDTSAWSITVPSPE